MAKHNNLSPVEFGGVVSAFTSVTQQQDKSLAVPLNAIVLPKRQPRRYFDPQKLEELKSSIEKYGILEPLIVRPLEGAKYELVAGERRYRAAKELNLPEVPVVIHTLNDKEAIQVALIENLQREDLNPIEETQGILNLLSIELDSSLEETKSLLSRMKHIADDPGHNVMPSEASIIQTIFASLGKGTWESYVKNKLPLLNLPEDLLEALEKGSIEYTKAQAIARIKDAEQRSSLLKKAVSENLSLNQIKEQIAKLKAAMPQERGILKNASYTQRLKDLSARTKKISWDDAKKQERFEILLKEMEALLSE